MKLMTRLSVMLALFLCGAALPAAAAITVENLRLSQEPDNLRVVLDVSATPEYKLFTLKHPHRLVVDLSGVDFQASLPSVHPDNALLSGIRVGQQSKQDVRLVLDLKQAVQPRSFHLKPYGPNGHRVVIDLMNSQADDEPSPGRSVTRARQTPPRELVIAIDAGHGGSDPGAIGRRYRTKEKDVVLAIALELEKQVRRTPGMRAVMIRDGDYMVALERRYPKAREQRANIFVSIHADAAPGREARGSSVYVLTERGASNRVAKFLANKKNASDLIGGVNLEDKDPLLQKVLVDLSQTSTISDSLKLGADVLTELKRVGPLHMSSVGQAGFAVLKAPDIPSILVETAFISNPTGEKKLRSKSYQRQAAAAILAGIKRFVAREKLAPSTHQMVRGENDKPRQHIVRRGDTLIGIANRYNTRVDALRFANNIEGSKLIIGTKLLIP